MGRGTKALGRLDRLLLRWIAFPLMSRAMRLSRTRFYQYHAEQDLLIAFHGLTGRNLHFFDGRPPGISWLDHVGRLPIDGGIVLDVGGFYGYTAGLFAQRAAKVFVFEPAPANIRLIEEHNRIRRLTNVEIVPVAVSDRSGEALLHLKDIPAHHSLGDIGASATSATVAVQTQTLDAFAASRNIENVALLKIDVEGFEPEVLNGAAALLGERRIANVLFEWSPRFYRQRAIAPDLPLNILRNHGYRVTRLDGVDFVFDPEDHRQRDLLAVPGTAGD